MGKKHWNTLKEPLNFKSKTKKPPVDTTLFRALAKTTIADFQNAVATFLQAIIAEDDATLTAAIDGKAARQMKDADGNPLLMLNIFAHNIKVTLMSPDVNGNKTNEPGCLKAHLHELFKHYPSYRPDGSVESSDSRLFMSSIDPVRITPAELLQTIRDHWQVENCLHWQKDRY